MAQVVQQHNPDRIKAALAVGAFHALMGYALITGLGFEVPQGVSENLKVFNVRQPPPPPPPVEEPPPPKQRTKDPEGEAAPPSLRARPTPVVAPPPRIKLPMPQRIATAPKKLPNAVGRDRSAGASDKPGTGTGAGGEGTGTGSGGAGTGSGGGGASALARPTRAKRISGALYGAADYPRAAKRAGAEGRVFVQYTVNADGRATNCRVTRSSGNAELDATTCRLIEARFRYKPATDAQGRPVPDVVVTDFTWSLPYLRKPASGAAGKNPAT